MNTKSKTDKQVGGFQQKPVFFCGKKYPFNVVLPLLFLCSALISMYALGHLHHTCSEGAAYLITVRRKQKNEEECKMSKEWEKKDKYEGGNQTMSYNRENEETYRVEAENDSESKSRNFNYARVEDSGNSYVDVRVRAHADVEEDVEFDREEENSDNENGHEKKKDKCKKHDKCKGNHGHK
jgi:hypothetical protein